MQILIDNKQHYKILGKDIDMVSLIKLSVEEGKVVRHEDWYVLLIPLNFCSFLENVTEELERHGIKPSKEKLLLNYCAGTSLAFEFNLNYSHEVCIIDHSRHYKHK